jgi:hypothetical protein
MKVAIEMKDTMYQIRDMVKNGVKHNEMKDLRKYGAFSEQQPVMFGRAVDLSYDLSFLDDVIDVYESVANSSPKDLVDQDGLSIYQRLGRALHMK